MAFIISAKDALEIPDMCMGNAELITFDIENVLTSAGDPELRVGAHEMIDRVSSQKVAVGALNTYARLRRVALLTNSSDAGFINAIEEQMPRDIPVLSGLEFKSKKTSGDMFRAAADLVGVDPESSIHVDDQVLSMNGARMAGFAGGILVKAYGETHHRGVQLFRPVDNATRRLIMVKQGAGDFVRSGL